MENKVSIELPNGKELVAEYYNVDGNHPEISVCIREQGLCVQDICLVRPHNNEDYQVEGNDIDCIVWSDESTEDYTHKFVISQYEEGA